MKYKILGRTHSSYPDFWDRVKAWQDFKTEGIVFRVIKVPVGFSYSRFGIIRFDTVKRKFLWWKWETQVRTVVLNDIRYYKGLYNGSSRIVPGKEVFVSIFEDFLEKYKGRIKTIRASIQKIDP